MEERFVTAAGCSAAREYRVRMQFTHPDSYPPEAGLTFQEVPPPYAAKCPNVSWLRSCQALSILHLACLGRVRGPLWSIPYVHALHAPSLISALQHPDLQDS